MQDTVSAVPATIAAIRFRVHNIYADSEATNFVARLINGLHVRTRVGVVRRELLFAVGDRYDSIQVAETERNLRRLGIFRRVSIDTTRVNGALGVDVTTQDGWSTQASFSLQSTGTQVAWRASLLEENLLGTASRFRASFTKDPDRNTFGLGFAQPRLVAGRIGLALNYEDRTDGYVFSGQVARPYQSLADRYGWSVGAETRDERILRYFAGERIASDTVFRLMGSVGAGYGWAGRADHRGYIRFGVGARVWQDDFLRGDSTLSSARLAYGVAWGSFEWRHARFVVTRGFRANRPEDVDLSTTIRTSLTVTPKGLGFSEHGVVPGLVARAGGLLGRNAFGYVDLAAHGRFTGAGLDSGSVQTGATIVLLPKPRHAAVLHAWGGWLHNPRPGGEFDLGLGLGPRAYRLHAYTGDRGVFATAEYRYMMLEDFLTAADVGIAAFVDYGGAWYQGSRRRTGWDFGVGLRFGTSRSTDLLLNRVDLAWRAGNAEEQPGWVIVIGKGLVFSPSSILNR